MGILAATLLGCGGDDALEEIYLVAAQALGPEAHLGREMVVNPLHTSPGNPELPRGALLRLAGAGFNTMGPGGEEDPDKATLYFSLPEDLQGGRFGLSVNVSMGGRPGTLRRSASGWRVIVDCAQGCRLREILPLGPRG